MRLETNRLSGVDVSAASMKARGRMKLKGSETGRRRAPCYVPFEVRLENLLGKAGNRRLQ